MYAVSEGISVSAVGEGVGVSAGANAVQIQRAMSGVGVEVFMPGRRAVHANGKGAISHTIISLSATWLLLKPDVQA